MNEEEIIKRLTKPKKYTLIEILRKFKRDGIENYIITKPELVQGLLDLYNKEKERNKDLEQIEKEHKEENGRLRDRIKELEKEKEKNKELMNKQLDFWFWLDDEEKKTTIKNMYIRKDKIRNKIKDLEKEIQEKHEYCTDFTLICEHEIDTNGIIRVLQELLEESDK